MSQLLSLCLLLVLPLLTPLDWAQPLYSVTTKPIRQAGQDQAIISSTNGASNVTIYCLITENNAVIDYNWTLYNSTTDTSELLVFNSEGISTDYPFISVTGDGNATVSNLTIDRFTEYMDRMRLTCEAINVSESFLFGIPGEINSRYY